MSPVYQILGLIATFIGLSLTFYTIVSRQNASFKNDITKRFTELDTKLNENKTKLDNRLEETRTASVYGFEKVTTQFNTMALQVNTILEGDIRELRGRLNKLESGQDDWTKELRQRTHDLAAMVDKQGYEIELIKIKCKDIK